MHIKYHNKLRIKLCQTNSKVGQRSDILGNARINGNEFVVNDADNINVVDGQEPENGGAGFKFDPNNGDPRINVYINGNTVGYWDSTGWK
ncbi:MAG: hypothetical protein P9X24_18665 [Candidatus Hatepunaea meridiana]|nr:hypothetical protein [Candidatus Hatepunaea meridiana]